MEEPGRSHSLSDTWWLETVAERDRLSEEINTLERRLRKMRIARRRLTRTLAENRGWKQRSGMSDAWQVLCRDIVPYIERWVQEYNYEKGTGAMYALSIRSNVSTKTLRRIVHGHQEFCTLTTAEWILAAIGMAEFSSNLEWYPANRGRPRKASPHDAPPSQYYEE